MLARRSMACSLCSHGVRLSHLCMIAAGKKKKGKHSKGKPPPADDDDIDAILAEIGEAPNEQSAPADEAQPGEHSHNGMPSHPLRADRVIENNVVGRGWQRHFISVQQKACHVRERFS